MRLSPVGGVNEEDGSSFLRRRPDGSMKGLDQDLETLDKRADQGAPPSAFEDWPEPLVVQGMKDFLWIKRNRNMSLDSTPNEKPQGYPQPS